MTNVAKSNISITLHDVFKPHPSRIKFDTHKIRRLKLCRCMHYATEVVEFKVMDVEFCMHIIKVIEIDACKMRRLKWA